jgi:hypothetical protein
MNKEFYINITSEDWVDLRNRLLTVDGKENAAVLLCGFSDSDSEYRLLVRSIVSVPSSQYDIREELHLRISPEFYNDIISICLAQKLTPVIIHSHPFNGPASYSYSDDYGESRLLPVLSTLLPDVHPASLLISYSDATGRRFVDGEFRNLTGLRIVGRGTKTIYFGNYNLSQSEPQFDRQVRAFGPEGQAIIEGLRVGIIGVGGIGSVVAEQIARLGVKDVVLIDDDQIETSNVSRMLGSTLRDIGKKKVDVVASHLHSIGVSKVVPIHESAIQQRILQRLKDRDVIFSCVDNDRTRSILNRFSHQYLLPVIDMGTRLDAREGTITGAAGRNSVIGSGLTCLRCSHNLNAERIRAESMPANERSQQEKEGYVMGIDEPAPSVISINTIMAGLGVTSALNLFLDFTGDNLVTSQLYDAKSGFVFTADAIHEAGCDICDTGNGVKGLGDLQIVSAY